MKSEIRPGIRRLLRLVTRRGMLHDADKRSASTRAATEAVDRE